MFSDSARGRASIIGLFGSCLLAPLPVRAQVGSGWKEYFPESAVQLRGCSTYDSAAGSERFGIDCANTSADNRSERRIRNDYTSGTRQFEGEVRVSHAGANICVKQTFMPEEGAFLIIAVASDGRLYVHGSGGEVAEGVFGRWVRINTIHDVAAGTIEIHADGVKRVTKTGGRRVAWHDKYGAYRTQSGRGPALVEWRNVRYWQDGRADGGVSGLGASVSVPALGPASRIRISLPLRDGVSALLRAGNPSAPAMAGLPILDLQGRRLIHP